MRTTLCLIVALCVASNVRFTHAQITVSASTFSGSVPNGMLNGSFTTDTAYNVSGCSSFSIGFATGTSAFSMSGSSFPAATGVNYFSAAPVCQSSSHGNAFKWLTSSSGAVMTIASESTTVRAGTTIIWFCVGTMNPRALVASGQCVVSSSNPFMPVCVNAPATANAITVGTALALNAADQFGNKATANAVSIVFTPASVIPSGSTITLATPYNYFATRAAAAAATGSSIACGTACTTVTVGNVAVTNTAAVDGVAAFGTVTVVTGVASTTASAITLTLGAGTLTTGPARAAPGNVLIVSVSSNNDLPSAGSALVALAPKFAVQACTTSDAPSNAAKSSSPTFAASLATISAFIFGLLLL
jgi:hypothetical protein